MTYNEDDLRIALRLLEQRAPQIFVNHSGERSSRRTASFWLLPIASCALVGLIAAGVVVLSHSHRSGPGISAAASTSPDTTSCSVGQLAPDTPTPSYGTGTKGTLVGFVQVSLRNTGSDCVLTLPDNIQVVTESGTAETVPVLVIGKTNRLLFSAGSQHGISVGDTWPIPGHATNCQAPIENVTSVRLTVTGGAIPLTLGMDWRSVCRTPPTLDIFFDEETNYQIGNS